MLISIYNLKGGTGKSATAYSLVSDLNYHYVTNDEINSVIPNIYPKVLDELNDEIIAKHHIIADMGGFFDETTKSILVHSDLIIIPLEADVNSLNSLNEFLPQLQEKQDNIIFIVNKVDKTLEKEYEEVVGFLSSNFNIDVKNIFKMPYSKIFKKIFDEHQGVSQLTNSSKLNKWTYRSVEPIYQSILNKINEMCSQIETRKEG